jgi:hypothetical protein
VAIWTHAPKHDTFRLSEKQVIDILEKLLKNVWVSCGDKILRQRIGIPMGMDCSPFLANLFLFSLEYTWIMTMLKNGQKKARTARKCQNTWRYIDDLCSLNNMELLKHIREIYGDLVTQTNK